jgi:hypothetical protein
MERTPSTGATPSQLFGLRGGEAPSSASRQPSAWATAGGAGTPAKPVSPYLQPLHTPRSDGPPARFRGFMQPADCPPPPGASLLDAQVRTLLGGWARERSWRRALTLRGPGTTATPRQDFDARRAADAGACACVRASVRRVQRRCTPQNELRADCAVVHAHRVRAAPSTPIWHSTDAQAAHQPLYRVRSAHRMRFVACSALTHRARRTG